MLLPVSVNCRLYCCHWDVVVVIVEQVCQEYGTVGSLADLQDNALFEEGGGDAAPGVSCLEATGDDTIYANASYANATLAGEEMTCGIYGEGTVVSRV